MSTVIQGGTLLNPPQSKRSASALAVPSATAFPYLHRALNDVRTGKQDRKLLLIGDSTTYGYGGTAGVGAAQHLASILASRGIPAAPELAVPILPSGFGTDSRWTKGTGWSEVLLSGYVWGGSDSSYNSTNAGPGTLFFINNLDYLYDTVDVYYIEGPAYGSVEALCYPSGTPQLITCTAGSPGIGKVTLGSTPTPAIGVGAEFGGVTTAASIIGVAPSLSSQVRLRVGNCGVEGATATSWALTNETGVGPLDCIKAYAPDVSVISLGINDATDTFSVATFLTNLAAVVAAAKVSGDVFVMSCYPSESTMNPTQEALYAAALPAWCASEGVGYIPTFEHWGGVGGWAQLNPLGWYFDSAHPSEDGYADAAHSIASVLLAA